MNLQELMQSNRKEELVAIYKFIEHASCEELARIIAEIIVCHDNLLVFNENIKSLDSVVSVCVNGESIQLNVEKDDCDLLNFIRENNEKI